MLAAVAGEREDLDTSGFLPHVSPCQCGRGFGRLGEAGQNRSRSGYDAKLHVLVDTAGRLLSVHPTPYQAGDVPQANPLLVGLRPSYVLADRAYNVDSLRRVIIEQEGEQVIPSQRNRKLPINHDRERNIVERGIGWFKQYHLATRYKKTASRYLRFVICVTVYHWLRNPFTASVCSQTLGQPWHQAGWMRTCWVAVRPSSINSATPPDRRP